MRKILVAATCAALSFTGFVNADEIVFKNGDKLSGSIVSGEGGKFDINTKNLGVIKVDMMDVASFKTDKPMTVKLNDGTVVTASGGKDGMIEAGGKNVGVRDIARINPAAPHWIGSLTAGGSLTRGNTDTEALSISAHAVQRRELDRMTFDAAYNYARQRDATTGVKSTSAENWMVEGKYDYFINPKLYAFGDILIGKDRIAAIDWRVAPSVGIGYQWVESEKLNFNTEAAVAYFYEKYNNGSSAASDPALRLAYHVDHKFNDHVQIFHNLKYFPKLDSISNYFITTDVGVRLLMYKNFFAEAKAQLDHNNRPAAGRQKDDTKYIFSVGWTFE